MKTYHGVRSKRGCRVYIREHDLARALPPREDLRNHSPTGFEWGYGGSGPAQLALALCADATGNDELALQVYQHYKESVVAHLDREDPWQLSQLAVVEWIARLGEIKESKH